MSRLLDTPRWISGLPDAVEEEPDDLVLVGRVVGEGGSGITVVSGGLCLTLPSDAVLSIEAIEPDTRRPGDSDRANRVVIKRGAALLDVRPRECVEGLIPAGRRPFPISTRGQTPRSTAATKYKALERAFLTAAGLTELEP
jgi:hypothetical protein